MKFGLIPEFVGRLPVVATLTDLDEAALVEILTEPKNALVKQYQKLFEMEDVRLDLHRGRAEGDRQARAIARKTGARGLRSIMERHPARDHVRPAVARHGVEEVVINKEVVDGGAKPLMIYAEQRKGDVGSAS